VHTLYWPNLWSCEVQFDDPEMLTMDFILCLQLTETKLYLSVFSDDILVEQGENMWCYNFITPIIHVSFGTSNWKETEAKLYVLMVL
jgi:hypothetical protein